MRSFPADVATKSASHPFPVSCATPSTWDATDRVPDVMDTAFVHPPARVHAIAGGTILQRVKNVPSRVKSNAVKMLIVQL